MRLLFTVTILAAFPIATTHAAEFPKFKTQEIDSGLKIGYAVFTADIDGDKKPDIVVVDQHKLVWYQNPGTPNGEWKKRVMLDGITRPDNVCAAPIDITGDGLPEIVIGSAWKPFDTANAAQLGWVKRGKTLDDAWTYHPLPCDEPTVHRVRVFDINGDNKPEIVHVPLMGRDSTKEKNWIDGRPLRVIALQVPDKDPEKAESWKPMVLSDSLHVAHNFAPSFEGGFARKGCSILVGSYEGVSLIYPEGTGDKWTTRLVHEGNQANPNGNRGASEIKRTTSKSGVIATIEPWHGNQVVVYASGKPNPEKAFSYDRIVIDEQLRWGHGVWFADLDGDGIEELIIGVRDDPNAKLGDKHTERRGVRLYKNTDDKGRVWERMILENGGVAVEDLCAEDLNGDGKIDIIAVGRATGNARIYWNQGK